MKNITGDSRRLKRLEKSKIRARKKDYNGAECEHDNILTVTITVVCLQRECECKRSQHENCYIQDNYESPF